MGFSPDSNIIVGKLSNIALPSTEVWTLFYDTENSNHLTGVKNVGGTKVVYDYEQGHNSPVNFIGTINASTNPSLPAGVKGDLYVISVSGSICNRPVQAGDQFIFIDDYTGGCDLTKVDFIEGQDNGIITLTYAEAQTLIAGNLLIGGRLYRITDPTQIFAGIPASVFAFTNTILLTANSSNTFSELYLFHHLNSFFYF